MRYLAKSPWSTFVCDIEGDRLLSEINVDDIDPIYYATIALRECNASSAAHLLDNANWTLEPLPLGEHRLLSPLDFRPGYFDD